MPTGSELPHDYLQKIKKNQSFSSPLAQKVTKTLQTIQSQFQSWIQTGQIVIQAPESSLNLQSLSRVSLENRSSNKFDFKQKNPFYIVSHPSEIKQKYQQFNDLKKQYSHSKTQQVTKQLEPLVKSWIKRQKLSQNKRKQLIQRQQYQKQLIIAQQEQIKRKSLQQKLSIHKQQIIDKIQIRKVEKTKQQNLRKSDSISKQMLKHKKPLFKSKEEDFIEKLRTEETHKELELKWKKQALMNYNASTLKQHRLKIASDLKKKSNQNSQSSATRSLKNKIDIMTSLGITNTKTGFTTTKKDHLMTKQEEQKKRLRIKQYIQRLKQMSPDESTLERIKKVKEQIISNQKLLQQNRQIRIIQAKYLKKQKKSLRNISTSQSMPLKNSFKNSNATSIDRNYLKYNQNNHKKSSSVKNDKIDENPEESESFQHSFAKQRSIDAKILKVKTQMKEKEPMKNSVSIKQTPETRLIKVSKSLKTLPPSENTQSKLPRILQSSYRPQYKNYIPEVKAKLIPKPQSQLQKIKRQNKNTKQAFFEFEKRSYQLQKKLSKKIGQFKKLQSNQNYEKNLLKQKEIDELYRKNLEIKLACIQID